MKNIGCIIMHKIGCCFDINSKDVGFIALSTYSNICRTGGLAKLAKNSSKRLPLKSLDAKKALTVAVYSLITSISTAQSSLSFPLAVC